MEVYRYKAMDTTGRRMRGQVDALNPVDLEARLGRIGLDLLSYKKVGAGAYTMRRHGITRKDLITFCMHLEQLLSAGVPMLDVLTDLRDSLENRRLQEITSAMVESVQGGKSLSESLQDFTYVFDAVFINLVRAGEQSGQVTTVLRNIVDTLKWQDEQAAYTKRLFIYPAFVTTVVLAALVSLMVFLVPQLLKFVKSMGQELPMHTKLLIYVSNAFAAYWYIFILAPVLLVLGALALHRHSPGFRLWLDGKVLRLPVLGTIIKKMIITRIANYFALMYAAGITVLECMRVAEEIAGNKAVEEAVRGAARLIGEGNGISSSFASTGLFPPLILRMLRVGENSGTLEAALKNVSYFYTRDVKESVDRLQAWIEPVMTLILAGLLLWVALSVLGPIYDLITQIKL